MHASNNMKHGMCFSRNSINRVAWVKEKSPLFILYYISVLLNSNDSQKFA